MTKIQIELPDAVAKAASQAGLLTSQAIERLIEEAIRREAGKKLLDAMQRLRDANVPPITEEDIDEAVSAARKTPR